MALYQITLFYQSVKSQQAALREINDEIRRIAGNNYRVLSAGEQVCAIGFETDLPREQLHERFQGLGNEHLYFLLVEVADIVQGYMSRDLRDWLRAHSPKK